MSKLITDASVDKAILSGAETKTAILGILAALNTAGLQESARTTITADATLTVLQCGLVPVDCTSGNVVLTLPTSGDTTDDAQFVFRRLDSTTNTLTIQRGGTDTIEGAATSHTIAANGILAMQMPADATNWRVTSIGGGTPLAARKALGLGAGADIASAATLPLAARTGNVLRVTGTTAVTDTDLEDGGTAILFPTEALPLTYHATNNPVQGGRSYVCEPGDMVIYSKDNSGILHNQIVRACGNTVAEVGQLVMTTGNAALPGTTKQNGSLLNRADYPNLWAFAAASGNIEASDATWSTNRTNNGTNAKYSPGDGSTTFRVPDVRGDFPRFWADGSTVDSGRAIGSAQLDDFKSHVHAEQGSLASAGSGYVSLNQSAGVSGSSNNTSATGGAETRPRNSPYLALVKF